MTIDHLTPQDNIGIIKLKILISMSKFSARFLFLTILAMLSGCSSDSDDTRHQPQYFPPEYSPRAETPEKYHFLFESDFSDKKIELIRESLPYSQIELERTECLGTCPSYVVRLRSDGTAEYIGRKFVDPIGTAAAEVYLFEYSRLCLALEEMDIQKLRPEYMVAVSDQSSAILRLKKTDSDEVIEITDYGVSGPNELWVILQAIDSVAKKLEWTLQATKTPQPQ